MSLAKLKKIHVIIIGAVLCVIAGVAMFFLLIKPQKEALAKVQADYNAAIVLGNPDAEAKAVKDLNDAVQQVAIEQQKLNVQMKLRMPYLNFSRRDIGMLALWKEEIKTLGPLLENFAHDKHVDVVSAKFSIPAPPVNPNASDFDNTVLAFDLGSVTVKGDFKSVMKNISRWNNCRRLVMVGIPTLSGISPNLMASYPLTCYIFPAVKGGAQIPMAGTPGSSDATGGQSSASPAATPSMPSADPSGSAAH